MAVFAVGVVAESDVDDSLIIRFIVEPSVSPVRAKRAFQDNIAWRDCESELKLEDPAQFIETVYKLVLKVLKSWKSMTPFRINDLDLLIQNTLK